MQICGLVLNEGMEAKARGSGAKGVTEVRKVLQIATDT